MKKKIVCLLLSIVMILPLIAMSACVDSNGTAEEEKERSSMTVDLWLPYYEGTTEESILLVQEALNAICENKYSTHLVLHFVPSSEYETAVLNRFDEIEEAKIQMELESLEKQNAEKEEGKSNKKSVETEEAIVTETDEYGIPVIVYPDVRADQMDLFLIRGLANYAEYIENDQLKSLDEVLIEGDPKLMKTFIYPSFLTYAKYDGTLYAIPNNRALGEYMFLMINKACVEEVKAHGVNLDVESVDDVSDILDFVSAVAKYCPDYVPVRGDFDFAGIRFWDAKNTGSFSLIASTVLGDSMPTNVFNIPAFTTTYYANKYIAEKSLSGDANAAIGTFAVATMKGSGDMIAEYGDEYYFVPIDSPEITTEEVCEYMIGINTNTRDVTRSAEILTLINTNLTFRTILQYGVEGIHWKYTDDSKTTITRLSNTYNMKLEETGNEYITFPDYGVSKDVWEYSKTQNLASSVSELNGFDTTMVSLAREIAEALADAEKEYNEAADLVAALNEEGKKPGVDIKDLLERQSAANKKLASAKTTLGEIKRISTWMSELQNDTATIYSSIEKMSASEFNSSISTLRDKVNKLSSASYLLYVEDDENPFTVYELTTDEKFSGSKTYYTRSGDAYYQAYNLQANAPIPANTYYEAVEISSMYSFAEKFAEFLED